MTNRTKGTPIPVCEPDPHAQVALLLQGAVHRGHIAGRALQSKDAKGCARAVMSALRIIDTLHAALDPRAGEIANRLQYLYSYVALRMLEGHGSSDPVPIAEATQLLAEIASGWAAIPLEQRAGPAIAA
ncbi:flagellar export chaperone FliS [Pseudomarimonas arenosa]|uniref:Flagellar secretion chaperone FliS n=1 Tax=Pseudomarimonas arenosa TaxID=2774145 RepID=A0AAW3ZEV6_9GAMM|nr:flagellar export chaperone FliS [Pseudomarimonas arenosa]MBD8524745.1 flagellar protein FliS [Pseudomarimonas arenosa]